MRRSERKMKIEITKLEQKMLLSACKSFKQADKDVIENGYVCEYGPIDKNLIKRWNALLRKIRNAK